MKQLYRLEITFTFAAEDVDEVDVLYDRILDLAEELGVHYEGGAVGTVPDDDLIPDSPLAKDLES